MKYIVLLGDGMADYPIPELGEKTPLQYAHTPNMDRIAREGTLGLVDTIPQGLKPGSDVANLTVLGYDAKRLYSGRGPLEAANMGIGLGPEDVAFRCNLITLGEGNDPVMEDFTAGHISSSEAAQIIRSLDRELGDRRFQFYPGVSYRHLFVWRSGADGAATTPPHDISDRHTRSSLPAGEGSDEVKAIMEAARSVLDHHPVNRARLSRGERPANAIWLWGQGRAPQMVKLTEHYHLKGGMISAVDLLNGIGIYAGLKVIHVEGATGYIDTNYTGKASAALASLREMDFVFLHVEAPDEMGHEGNVKGKIRAIEDFDAKVVGPVLAGAEELGPIRILVLSDHPTPICTKTHACDPSPFAVWSSVPEENRKGASAFNEAQAKASKLLISPGYGLMDLLIAHWRDFIERYH